MSCDKKKKKNITVTITLLQKDVKEIKDVKVELEGGLLFLKFSARHGFLYYTTKLTVFNWESIDMVILRQKNAIAQTEILNCIQSFFLIEKSPLKWHCVID